MFVKKFSKIFFYLFWNGSPMWKADNRTLLEHWHEDIEQHINTSCISPCPAMAGEAPLSNISDLLIDYSFSSVQYHWLCFSLSYNHILIFILCIYTVVTLGLYFSQTLQSHTHTHTHTHISSACRYFHRWWFLCIVL